MDIGEAIFGPSASTLSNKYNKQLTNAATQYGQSVDTAMSPFAALARQTDLSQAQQNYLNQLSGFDASKYQVNAGDYNISAPDVSAATVQSYLDPSIDYQINKANQATMSSAANRGSLFSGATGNAISENARQAAQTGWENAFDKARQAGLDVNSATQSNLANQFAANKANVDMYNNQLANAGTAYQTVMSPFEQLANANLAKAGTMYNTATTAAGNQYTTAANQPSPFQQFTNIASGVGKVYSAFK